jgi:hypothetical protein
MQRCRIILASSLFAATLPFAVHAEGSGSSVPTDTGSLLRAHLYGLQSLLTDRIVPSRESLIQAPSKTTGWLSDVASYVQKRTSLRMQCHDQMRAANRDTMLTVALRCERADFLQEMSFLRKQSDYIAKLPGITVAVRRSATGSIASLMDAQSTIVNAIDSNVFDDVSSLQSARDKLRTQYHEPYWLAVTRVQADRDLTWISLIAKRLSDLVAAPHDAAFENPLLHSVDCLNTAALSLRTGFFAASEAEASLNLTSAQTTLSGCREGVRGITRLLMAEENKTGEMQSSSAP